MNMCVQIVAEIPPKAPIINELSHPVRVDTTNQANVPKKKPPIPPIVPIANF